MSDADFLVAILSALMAMPLTEIVLALFGRRS